VKDEGASDIQVSLLQRHVGDIQFLPQTQTEINGHFCALTVL